MFSKDITSRYKQLEGKLNRCSNAEETWNFLQEWYSLQENLHNEIERAVESDDFLKQEEIRRYVTLELELQRKFEEKTAALYPQLRQAYDPVLKHNKTILKLLQTT